MRINLKFTLLLIPAIALALLTACGGSADSQSAPASLGFTYTNPASTGYSLIRNSASTDTHLILDLVGPSGGYGRGVGFNLQSDGTVSFARFGDRSFVKDLGVFNTYNVINGGGYYGEPLLVNGGLKKNGTLLTVGVFQKDRYVSYQYLGQPLFQIAIDFDANTAALTPGKVIPLAITKAKAIPYYIGTPPADPSTATSADWGSVVANYNTSLLPVDIAVGTLVTK